MLRWMVFLLSAFAIQAKALNQTILIDKSMLERNQKQKEFLILEGPAQKSQEENAQLLFYLRGCGMVKIPSNKKGEAPKEGQRIRVFIKKSCQIDDWEKA